MPLESDTGLLPRPETCDLRGSSVAGEQKHSSQPIRRMTGNRLIRREFKDRSQWLRHGVQAAFAILNLWIGIQFILWTRYYETAGTGWRTKVVLRVGKGTPTGFAICLRKHWWNSKRLACR